MAVVEERNCDIDSVRKLLEQNSKLVVVYTGKDCPVCPSWMEKVKETLKGREDLGLVEVELGKGEYECELAADAFNVKATPTTLFFQDGKLKRMIRPTGDDQKDLKLIERIDEDGDQNLQVGGGTDSRDNSRTLPRS